MAFKVFYFGILVHLQDDELTQCSQVTSHKLDVDEDVLRKIKGSLQLELPRDFRILIRNAIKLPTSFVVLAEPPNSIIVMNTENNPYVIW